jgi:hypothetical protein
MNAHADVVEAYRTVDVETQPAVICQLGKVGRRLALVCVTGISSVWLLHNKWLTIAIELTRAVDWQQWLTCIHLIGAEIARFADWWKRVRILGVPEGENILSAASGETSGV